MNENPDHNFHRELPPKYGDMPESVAGFLRVACPSQETLKGMEAEVPEGCTTVMFRCIPRRIAAEDIVKELDFYVSRCGYDYVYVPWDKSATTNMGYGFVNFVSNDLARACVALIDNTTWRSPLDDPPPMKLTSAHLQGLVANVLRHEGSSAFDERNCPWVLLHGIGIPLQDATRLIRSGTWFELARRPKRLTESEVEEILGTGSRPSSCLKPHANQEDTHRDAKRCRPEPPPKHAHLGVVQARGDSAEFTPRGTVSHGSAGSGAPAAAWTGNSGTDYSTDNSGGESKSSSDPMLSLPSRRSKWADSSASATPPRSASAGAWMGDKAGPMVAGLWQTGFGSEWPVASISFAPAVAETPEFRMASLEVQLLLMQLNLC
mmetsp:Transcript_47730/g.102289  ORF Transcript_47730/g.102289 Transcript_47730/m.102289 type:complete len:377 (-) Transcript_47730:276-1406(-)|eukprot:CAMPEP_0206482112 /NCGR_PEP_ID=MMETSP0324_2-20121206/38659_1 /ASSEMBLY_ACC=CAM_ASM_000836 /TAXON_ID=2866 /ORGANISM="Crypthecodinium cohnii, Strain Seligo" /LENGTH=376 /DNA_ID=CAMNT_0053959955 /DNA_START=299 /DNA_END=1429 /DNA_ORIENTATION=+